MHLTVELGRAGCWETSGQTFGALCMIIDTAGRLRVLNLPGLKFRAAVAPTIPANFLELPTFVRKGRPSYERSPDQPQR